VTSVDKIIKGLIPLLFATLLLTIMFAHAFRAKYIDETCMESYNILYADGWTHCNTVSQSYMQALRMFLPGAEFDYEGSGRVLTIVYAVFMGVILLNMIIAYVCNIFSEVLKDSKTAFWENRLSITTEIEALSNICHNFSWKKTNEYEVCELNTQRLNFSIVPSLISSNEICTPFFNWWFSHTNSGCECPHLMTRMYAFYSYSQWDDIVYPGIVLERILHGLKYNEEIVTEYTHPLNIEQSHPSILSRIIVKMVLYQFFFIHVVAIIVVFIFGSFSFGIFWPEAMKKSLFHMDTKHHFNEMEELSNKNDKSKEELRGEIRILERNIDNMKIKQEQGLELSRGIMHQLEKMELVMRKE